MLTSAEQTGGAATVTEPTFADFKASKAAGTLATPSTEKPGADPARAVGSDKPAPQSDADTNDQTELTDKDTAEEKPRVRNKMARLLTDRANARAEAKLYKQQLDELKSSQAATEQTSKRPAVEGKPKLKTFLESGKYEGWDEAHDAFLEARDDWRDQQNEQKEAGKRHEGEQATVRSAYDQSVEAFETANPKANYGESFKIVAGMLDGDDLTVSNAIVRSKDPAALVHYLGTHEDALEELAGMPVDEALQYLGEIKAQLPKSKSPETPNEKTVPVLPKTPRSVAARGDVPNADSAMYKAAEGGNFKAFQTAKRQKQRG